MNSPALPCPVKPILNKTFSFRLTNDLTERLDVIAAKNGWTRAALMRYLILDGVRSLEGEAGAEIKPF